MQQTSIIRKLTESHSQDAITLLADEFSRHSPLHRAMGITSPEYRCYLSDNWHAYAFDGPVNSLGAFCTSSNELLGCLISTHFPTNFDHKAKVPDKHKPIAALLQALEKQHLQQGDLQHKCLLVDLAVVKTSYRGLGIYQLLREELHKLALSGGYKTVYGQLSSSATQHVCVNTMGHKVVAEIHYCDFRYKNKTPFGKIEEPRSIKMVRTSV